MKAVPVATVPEGAIARLTEAIGKLTLVDLYPGEIILAQRLVDPNVTSGDGRQALVVAGEDVLMAFPADDLMSKTGVLKPGDHVDLLFTLDFPVYAAAAAGAGGSRRRRRADRGGHRKTRRSACCRTSRSPRSSAAKRRPKAERGNRRPKRSS